MMNRRELFLGTTAVALTHALPAQTAGFTGLSGRPPAAARRFRSDAVDAVIAGMRSQIGSADLFQTFENCLPNTLDTTVFPGKGPDGQPDTYVITGDIDAMWMRDSSAQVWPYLEFVKEDPALRSLLEGVIRRQARLILLDSYANSFTRHASDPALSWAVHDETDMRPGVAERKWEIDSLCYPVRLAHGFWKATGQTRMFDSTWLQAARRIVETFREQQRFHSKGPYHFARKTAVPTDTMGGGGFGSPVKPNGMICSGFRPSDDACTFLFFVPANLFAVVTLQRLSEIAQTVYNDTAFSKQCAEFAAEVHAAVMQHGIVKHPRHGDILAFEVDGYGNVLLMDDANAPGLLSLAYLQVLPVDDPLYQRTRAFALSEDNPFFVRGAAGEGVGGPHIGQEFLWPMSILIRALTSQSLPEIEVCLKTLCNSTAGTHFMHETFHKDDPKNFTRAWFAWANGLFGELILKVHREYPGFLKTFRPA